MGTLRDIMIIFENYKVRENKEKKKKNPTDAYSLSPPQKKKL